MTTEEKERLKTKAFKAYCDTYNLTVFDDSTLTERLFVTKGIDAMAGVVFAYYEDSALGELERTVGELSSKVDYLHTRVYG